MAPKVGHKRLASGALRPSKKRKVSRKASVGDARKSKEKGKKLPNTKDLIVIPLAESDVDLSDQDFDIIGAYEGGVSFLNNLDPKALSRSKKETLRLHQLTKAQRLTKLHPSLSAGEDEDSLTHGSDSESGIEGTSSGEDLDSDAEMLYENIPRQRKEPLGLSRLPIKLPNGQIQGVPGTVHHREKSSSSSPSELSEEESDLPPPVEDVSTGARFGRPAVRDVLGDKSMKNRIEGAKDQIASICQDIISDPENSVGLLRRLHTFSLPQISTPNHPEPIKNDTIIRRLAALSELAVFMDIIPGYRIRTLTDKEKAEKVSQMVARTRDWEQGLVSAYQTFLQGLETELKVRSELAETALKCMCTLLSERTHFNFRTNLIDCIVARLSRKSWDGSSSLCLDTLIKVFRTDNSGEASMEIVQTLNRMIKERRFSVHPEVLSCLVHLRLKTELGVRASNTKTDRNITTKHDKGKGKGKAKGASQPHVSKKAKRALKEKKEIDREYREAEAEIDKEERANTQTETLKLLFVLYFRILKNPVPTPLLPAALNGVSKFAHLVNIDFFKDLMNVLKGLIELHTIGEFVPDDSHFIRDIQHRLLCIVTAFELLSGQGEALNIELTDFVSQLYKIILPLSHLSDIGTPHSSHPTNQLPLVKTQPTPSIADMLFRALNIVFSPRSFGIAAPPWCAAAFSKRLLTAALHWPPAVASRALDFVAGLIAKDSKLEALLSTEDRVYDGVYRPDVDDPQLSNPFGSLFWELHILSHNHWDAGVRREATQLLNFVPS